MVQPSLRPQDVVVLAKLLSYDRPRPSMAQMGTDLSISPSEIHGALKRLALARLVSSDTDGHRPLLDAVLEFLIHGLKYAFPARRGEFTRGVPTSHAAPPLNQHIAQGGDLLVWAYPLGNQRGVSLEPLYKTVPAAALRDERLYEFLALIDALREGRARERNLAEKELTARLRRLENAGSKSSAARKRR